MCLDRRFCNQKREEEEKEKREFYVTLHSFLFRDNFMWLMLGERERKEIIVKHWVKISFKWVFICIVAQGYFKWMIF